MSGRISISGFRRSFTGDLNLCMQSYTDFRNDQNSVFFYFHPFSFLEERNSLYIYVYKNKKSKGKFVINIILISG